MASQATKSLGMVALRLHRVLSSAAMYLLRLQMGWLEEALSTFVLKASAFAATGLNSRARDSGKVNSLELPGFLSGSFMVCLTLVCLRSVYSASRQIDG